MPPMKHISHSSGSAQKRLVREPEFHAEHLFVPGVDDIPGGLHVVIFLTGDSIFFQQLPVPLKLTFCIVPLCTDFFNAGIVDSQIVLSGGDSRVRDLLPRQGKYLLQ